MSHTDVNVKYDERFDYNNMNQKPKGRCIIFNQKFFDSSGMKERTGTDEDAEALKSLFKNMGLTVRQYNNFTSTGIITTLRQVPDKVSTEDDFIIVCILTYGQKDGDKEMLWAKDVKYSNDDLFRRFTEKNCPKLKCKPKIFIIQAYPENGEKIVAKDTDSNSASNNVISLTPLYSDFCIVYSDDGRLISDGAQITGSWFVQTLVRELREKSKNGFQILDMLTRVNRVLQKNGSFVKTPFIISSLKKRVFLGPIDNQGTNTVPEGFNLSIGTFSNNEDRETCFIYGPLSDKSCDSKLDPGSMGQCIIFNHEIYSPSTRFTERKGTEFDAQQLKRSFSTMGFVVSQYDNYRVSEIFEVLSNVSKQDHNNNKCIVICVLTHGGDGELCAYDGAYATNKLFHYFTDYECPTLKNKPKMFFIQACRGESFNKEESRGGGKGNFLSNIPNNPDILVAFCTVPGFVAVRNPERGSWFIQALVKQFYMGSDDRTHVLDMLTRVNDAVSQEYASNALVDTLQIPCFVSSLCDSVYLRKT